MKSSRFGMTEKDYPSKRVVMIFVFCAILIIVVGLGWNWWHRAPDANTAMARGQYQRAFALFREAANDGDPAAQTSLGNLYYLGMGTERDYLAAVNWYFAAAKQRHAPAQLNLGHMYQQGLGVIQDPVRAFAWYNMSDKTGNPEAELYLGQVTSEWTLSPMMISTAQTRWAKLESLLEAGL